MITRIYYICFLLTFVLQCTTIGFHEKKIREGMEFGDESRFRVCLITEPDITKEEISDLFTAWNHELKYYNLKAEPILLEVMERPGFWGTDILGYLMDRQLTKDCDRLLYLKGRTWGDITFEVLTLGLFVGVGVKLEVQGAVEGYTNTRGYIKAKYISTIQMLFTSPNSTLIHEGYHLLGCGHQLFMKDCYERIRDVKLLLTDPSRDPQFFPVITTSGKKILTRPEYLTYPNSE
ncbi:hypothetical protein ND861_11180 [Leptospira sp. 2 VSF19]|uniref:Lipoprotein n=1 Tax=Leptospira soteropolitanensis TaxID=2950025 RepID=A0AAW5VP89_9LEPT|nr:hypothetical protein [Leptospira soteropolitanensis]MCW7493134.1 hypothetical protein [Leptospira soteropolitanensis]MCW7500797.1 hypothetical protein [Leptospira soteropolitanensis]MCW7522984.1 hypothetical protein [Leptospira soteropolitanensis]MCW7526909.1 hypothetical protein [Leptospira soteropolitanensis]MCW7530702.1 hypothetical protein [Leptospira soteropolitanensis]